MPEDELAWETTDSRIAYTCPGFDVIHESVRLPDGTHSEFDHVLDDPAVVVIPVTTGGSVVVIDEWRQSVKRINQGFPAGSIEPTDQDRTEAARRELEEETGYVAETLTELDGFEPANGLLDATFHFVLAEGCRQTGTRDLDHNESIRVDTTTFEELETRLEEGRLEDGRTALGLLLYKCTR
ncbi:MAG: NUDIX hydrolase [Halodesulfurarchaeum sp.]